jgi:hypothetical protein
VVARQGHGLDAWPCGHLAVGGLGFGGYGLLGWMLKHVKCRRSRTGTSGTAGYYLNKPELSSGFAFLYP